MGCQASKSRPTPPAQVKTAADGDESELEAVAKAERAVLKLTEGQVEAMKAAEATQNRLVTSIQRHGELLKDWKESGGHAIESLLEDADLIDLNYVIELLSAGGIVPRWQDVPDSARINHTNIWRLRCWAQGSSVAVLVLSYPWLDAEHPDRVGAQLRRLLPIFRVLLDAARVRNKGGTVGLMMDFMSLPQKPFRAPEELARFKRALGRINEWYAHPYTHVLIVDTPLPTGEAYTNRRPYKERGWCYFEMNASAIVKQGFLVWRLSRWNGKATSYGVFRRELQAGRTPPISPERFAREMRAGVAEGALRFTAGVVDMEFVLKQYDKCFVRVFETYSTFCKPAVQQFSTHDLPDIKMVHLDLVDTGWGDNDMRMLIEALQYAEMHCRIRGPPVLVSVGRSALLAMRGFPFPFSSDIGYYCKELFPVKPPRGVKGKQIRVRVST